MSTTIADMKVAATLDQFADLGRLMFEESRFRPHGFDRAAMLEYAQGVYRSSEGVALGAFDGPALVGMCIGACGAILIGSRATLAAAHLLFVAPPYRGGFAAPRLIRSFIQHARARGAQNITFSTSTGVAPERTGRLFKACGLSPIGSVYTTGD